MKTGLQIEDVRAIPCSVPIANGAVMAIGRTVKRDVVLVRIQVAGGIVGWGEAHHGRCPGAIANLINTTLSQLVLGMDAANVAGVWERMYSRQLSSHGMGAAAAIGMSGIDQALWDIRGKAVNWPIYRLLGGERRAIPVYAGGPSLGYVTPQELIDEVQALVDQRFKAIKMRLGDTVGNDIMRLEAVRKAFPNLGIMVDCNTGYLIDDIRRLMPALEENRVEWLEEPFSPHDNRSYLEARRYGNIPLAAGENHYTRFEFSRVLEDGVITILQPDLSKTGGITEAARIAAMASAYKLRICPHTSATSLNMASSIHLLSAIENGGYFEADAATENPLRDMVALPRADVLDEDGMVWASTTPGLGVEIDEGFLRAHPLIEGPSSV